MAKPSDFSHKQDGYGRVVSVAYRSDIAIITMDRGENRMNDEFIDQMNSALDEVLSKPNVKAIITTGQGKFYSNGLDLKWLMDLTASLPDSAARFITRWHELQLRVLTCPVLTVAAINGHSFAGGGVLALCHDFRVMNTDRGWWCLNEVHLGLKFPTWILELVKLKLSGNGGKTMVDVVLCGKKYTADEAKACGIVDDTAPASELISKAVSVVNSRVGDSGFDRQFIAITKQGLFGEVTNVAEANKVSPFAHQSQL